MLVRKRKVGLLVIDIERRVGGGRVTQMESRNRFTNLEGRREVVDVRSSLKLLRCRTSLYRNSLIPNLKQEVNLLPFNLS